MKRTIYLLCLLTLVVFLASGCDNEETTCGSVPPYNYELMLKFENNSGKNLATNLAYKDMQEKYPLITSNYELQVLLPDASPKSEFLYATVANKQVDYVVLWEGTFNNVASTITWKLMCEHLFGDREEHTITSYWEKDKTKIQAVCVKLTCDGKEFPLKLVQNSNVYTSVITLDQ